MKYSKKTGKVRLEANEVRVGNFFVRRDDQEIKITDLNGVFHHSVNRRMPIGIWLENIWSRAYLGEEVALTTLKAYIATMWSLFSIAPDDEFLAGLLDISRSALERHPQWYGYNPDGGEEGDRKAAEEVKEMKEFEREVRETKDDADTQE